MPPLRSGEEVVVKVVRPNLKPIISQDLAWLFMLANTAERISIDARRLHLVEVVDDYAKTIYDELDLLREAANASQLRRNFEGSALLYVPQVYWDYCRSQVLVMERIYGVPVTDMAGLARQNTDMRQLAERGVEIFFTQVFRDSFFHADMHPGNIFVSTHQPWSPQYIAVDFGIVGSLTPEDQDYLARNLMAFFKRDYRKVAQLHIDSGWVPAETKVNEFEAAIRTVCEPIFEKPLKDISFGQLLVRLFQVARRFNMEVQPQLVLLQKTLLNIEGLGRELYPDLDLWSTGQPYLERWMRERMGPRQLLKNAQAQIEQLPHLAHMTRELLERMSHPHANNPPPPWRERRHWPLRLVGAILLGSGATLAAGAELYRPQRLAGLDHAGGRHLHRGAPIAIAGGAGTLDALSGESDELAGRNQLERRWPGPGDCPGPQDRSRADDGLDESRGAAADRAGKPRHLLVTFAWQAVAQGRGVRTCAAAARTAPGL